jgi:hypothetical protein
MAITVPFRVPSSLSFRCRMSSMGRGGEMSCGEGPVRIGVRGIKNAGIMS